MTPKQAHDLVGSPLPGSEKKLVPVYGTAEVNPRTKRGNPDTKPRRSSRSGEPPYQAGSTSVEQPVKGYTPRGIETPRKMFGEN